MELQLFKPVPTKLLVKIYGTTLEKVKEGDKSEPVYSRLFRLKAELKKLGVAVDSLPGIKLATEEEAKLLKEFADCYKISVHNMTWSEIMMNYVKLYNYGFMDAATIIRDEMTRRGHMEESDDEIVVDSLCRIANPHAMDSCVMDSRVMVGAI